jgi:YggT family protein
VVQLIATGILWWLRQYPWVLTPPQFFLVALGSLLGTILMFYTFALVLYVLLSWVAPGTYSPASALVSSLCEPLLRPVRRVIPPLGGIDFSALFVIIALQALYIAIGEYLLTPGY